MDCNIDFYDTAFLEKLKDLHILTRKLFHARLRGKRRSLKKGSSLEFADYKKYSAGDDFRFIDWNILSRLQCYMIKSYWDEENINIYIFIDASASMAFGNPPKFLYAKKIAGSLSAVSLFNHDSVGISLFSNGVDCFLPSVSGKNQINRCFDYLNKIKPNGSTDFLRSVDEYSRNLKDKGVFIIISDFFDENGYQKAVLKLISRGFDVNLIHINSKPSVKQDFHGNVSMIDSESGETLEINLDDQFIKTIEMERIKYHDEIKRFCLLNRVYCFSADTEIPFDEFVLGYFKRQLFYI